MYIVGDIGNTETMCFLERSFFIIKQTYIFVSVFLISPTIYILI